MTRIGLLATATLLLLGACTDEGPRRPDPDPAPGVTATEPPGEAQGAETPGGETSGRRIPIQVWFLDPGGDNAQEIKLLLHHVEIPATLETGKAALETLIAGIPDDAPRNAFTVVPEDTELLGLTIENGTATVDFSSEFEETGMGTFADGLQIPQVVYTLTQFPTVKRVVFEVEGERVGTKSNPLGGHGILLTGRSQTRKDWESMLPPITVFTPYADQELTPPFTLTGIANVFEATVSYRIRDGSGNIIHKGFTTATCGTGCYGTFVQVIDVEIDEPTQAVLEVFESSAEDGRPLHMQRVPLNLEPRS